MGDNICPTMRLKELLPPGYTGAADVNRKVEYYLERISKYRVVTSSVVSIGGSGNARRDGAFPPSWWLRYVDRTADETLAMLVYCMVSKLTHEHRHVLYLRYVLDLDKTAIPDFDRLQQPALQELYRAYADAYKAVMGRPMPHRTNWRQGPRVRASRA